MMEYPIWYQNEKVGTACVCRCGLYAQITCSCQYADNSFCKILMRFSDKTIDLGSWIREGNCYSLQRKIPAKSFGSGTPAFIAVDKAASLEVHKFPMVSNSPFDRIHQLRNGRLYVEDNAVYLIC